MALIIGYDFCLLLLVIYVLLENTFLLILSTYLLILSTYLLIIGTYLLIFNTYLLSLIAANRHKHILLIVFLLCGAFGRGDICGGYQWAAPKYEMTNSK